MKRIFVICLLCAVAGFAANAQTFGVKTNLLYWGTGSPNLGLEMGLGKKTTLSVSGGTNFLKLNPKKERGTTPSLKHVIGEIEFRYWFCKRFDGVFLGLEGMGGTFTAEDILFVDLPRNYRYDGSGYGGGFVFGYHWPLGKHWGMEASIGGTIAQLEYDKIEQGGGANLGKFKQTYVGPSKLNFSFMYFFN